MASFWAKFRSNMLCHVCLEMLNAAPEPAKPAVDSEMIGNLLLHDQNNIRVSSESLQQLKRHVAWRRAQAGSTTEF